MVHRTERLVRLHTCFNLVKGGGEGSGPLVWAPVLGGTQGPHPMVPGAALEPLRPTAGGGDRRAPATHSLHSEAAALVPPRSRYDVGGWLLEGKCFMKVNWECVKGILPSRHLRLQSSLGRGLDTGSSANAWRPRTRGPARPFRIQWSSHISTAFKNAAKWPVDENLGMRSKGYVQPNPKLLTLFSRSLAMGSWNGGQTGKKEWKDGVF